MKLLLLVICQGLVPLPVTGNWSGAADVHEDGKRSSVPSLRAVPLLQSRGIAREVNGSFAATATEVSPLEDNAPHTRRLEEQQPKLILCKSPYDGIFASWSVKPGDNVSKGSALAVLQNTEHYSAIVEAPAEGQIVGIQTKLSPGDEIHDGDNIAALQIGAPETTTAVAAAPTTPAPVIIYRDGHSHDGSSKSSQYPMIMISLIFVILLIVCCIGVGLSAHHGAEGGSGGAGGGEAAGGKLMASWLEGQPLLSRRSSEAIVPTDSNEVAIEFSTGTSYQLRREPSIVRCSYKPLGIVFPKKLPITVEGFHYNSYARTLGVHPGWAITRIAEHDVSRELSFERVEALLQHALAKLPVWPLRIVFRDNNDHDIPLQMQFRPLGITFVKRSPLTVESFSFNSYAELAGVQEGWKVLAIGEEDVRDERFDIVEQVLHDSLVSLPMWPLRVDFRTGSSIYSDDVVTKYFEFSPVGFNVSKGGNVTAVEPMGQAEFLGVQVGWVAIQIGNVGVARQKTSELQDMLDEGTEHLPEFGGDQEQWGQ